MQRRPTWTKIDKIKFHSLEALYPRRNNIDIMLIKQTANTLIFLTLYSDFSILYFDLNPLIQPIHLNFDKTVVRKDNS